MTRRVATLLALLALAAGATACGVGVPVNSSPQVIKAVPDNLLAPRDQAHPPDVTKHKGDVFDIYLVANNQLVGALRSGSNPTAPLLLQSLDAGPLPYESGEGITTQIPSGAQASIVSTRGHVVTVNLESSFGELPLLGVAQIVYTLTQLHGVTGVAFYEEGSRVDAPTEDGTYIPRPLTRNDFANDAQNLEPSNPRPTKPPCAKSGPHSGTGSSCSS